MAIGLVASHAPPAMSVPPTQESLNASQAAVESPPPRSGLKETAVGKAPRVGHKKSRKGCAQCKRRHVKCNEESPCSNCSRHGVLCSLAGGPFVARDDAKVRRKSTASSSTTSMTRTTSLEASGPVTSTPTASSGQNPPSPSPFATLTGLIDRPMNGVDQTWPLDIQLMHYYMQNARYILTEQQDVDYIMRIWTDELPKVAFSYDYVLHALLGFTALHKAYLDSEQAGFLQTCAVDHLDKALMLYRRDRGTPPNSENANARYAFTWLVALFAYAVPPSVPPIDSMVELFMLVRGIDAVLSDSWYFVAQGPFSPILSRGFQEAIAIPPDGTYPISEGMDFGLNHLDFMLGVEAMLPDDRRSCALILSELKQTYQTVLQTQGGCSVANILCFPKQDPTPFASLVKRRLPQALIILSYYCVLLDILDNRWWINGWASRVLTDILGGLDEVWKHWLEWPVEHVIMKQHRAVATTGASTNIAALLL